MMIFGHRFIASESFYHINTIDSIIHTPSSSIICLEFDEEKLDITAHATLNKIPFALRVANTTEIIYAATLGAKYIIVLPKMAKTAHNLAENYLFDAKILVLISEEEEIEELALLGVDGVIFSNAIIKTNA